MGVSIQNGPSSAEVDHNTITYSYVGIDLEGSNHTIHHNPSAKTDRGTIMGEECTLPFVTSSDVASHNNIQNNGGYGVSCSGLWEPWLRLGEGNNQG